MKLRQNHNLSWDSKILRYQYLIVDESGKKVLRECKYLSLEQAKEEYQKMCNDTCRNLFFWVRTICLDQVIKIDVYEMEDSD